VTKYIMSPIAAEIDPTAQATLEKIMNIDLIKDSLDAGGWIAGGFVRNVLLGMNLADYFHWPNKQFNYTSTRQGDIDVFFPTADAANEVIDRHSRSSGRLNPSVGKFAMEAHRHSQGMGSVSIQLVNHSDLCVGSIADCLDRFDFENCRVGLNKAHSFYPEGWRELESTKLIKISSNHSPFLGSRIVKYLNHRSMVGLTPDSTELLVEWLCRAATEAFPGYESVHMHGIKAAVMHIADKGFLAKEDLILFLGKWKKVLSENHYGQHYTVEVDWALHKIEELNAVNNDAAL